MGRTHIDTDARPQRDARGRAALAEIVRELETDLAVARAKLETRNDQARAAENRAMAAIRAGDDVAARRALIEQHSMSESRAQLEADVTVLEEMLKACRAVLGNQHD